MGNGHGISDAVRGAINDWMVPEILGPVNKALGKTIFGWQVNDAKQWVRRTRSRGDNGWVRKYECKTLPALSLIVNANDADTHIEYVTFRVDNKVVAGGAVNVPSVNVSQKGRDTSLDDLKITKTSAPKTTPLMPMVKFKPFTAKQIAQFEAELEFGAAGLVDRMLIFDERV
jgi:hypothetical protein